MGYSLALAAVLCLTSLVNGQQSNCCIKNRNRIIRQENIVAYKVQIKGFCPITSVAFLTKANKWICWDPQEQFAIKAIQRVEQARLMEQEEKVTTTPATAKDIGQTTAQLSSGNSTQIQTENRAVITTTADKKKKNLKRRTKGRRRNRRKQ